MLSTPSLRFLICVYSCKTKTFLVKSHISINEVCAIFFSQLVTIINTIKENKIVLNTIELEHKNSTINWQMPECSLKITPDAACLTSMMRLLSRSSRLENRSCCDKRMSGDASAIISIPLTYSSRDGVKMPSSQSTWLPSRLAGSKWPVTRIIDSLVISFASFHVDSSTLVAWTVAVRQVRETLSWILISSGCRSTDIESTLASNVTLPCIWTPHRRSN